MEPLSLGMTDPQQAFDDQDVTTSDDKSDRALVSPAISISPVQYGGRSGGTNHGYAHQDTSGASAAYATNPYLGSAFSAFHFDSPGASQGSHSHASIYETTTPSNIGFTANQNPALGTFGSQEWVPPAVPYLDFAPQPTYEPTGELINEQIDTFDHFDSPPTRRELETAQARNSSQASSKAGENGPKITPPPRGVFAPPPPLRSALKRKAENDPNSPTASEEGRRRRSTDTAAAAARTVTFGRMSDPGHSLSGDGLTNPDLIAEEFSGRPDPSGTARLRSQKPTEEGVSSRAPTQVPSTAPKQAGKGSGIVYKGKASSPSILPPEKVFPIQIGSELFRLSGASISSDGLYLAMRLPLSTS